MKRILSLLLILLLLFSLAACGTKQEEKTPAEETQEEAVEEYPGLSADPEILTQDKEDPDRVAARTMTKACIKAMLIPDFDAVLDMVHPDILAHSMRQKEINNAQYRAMIDSYNARAQAAMGELDNLCKAWKIEPEILAYEDMPSDRLYNLRESYKDVGIRIDDGIEVQVQFHANADGVMIPLKKMVFAFIQSEDQWYLETSRTELMEETTP